MRMSRDVAWALGVVVLVALGTSVVGSRMNRVVSLAAVSPESRPTPIIALLDERERARVLKDDEGRRYRLDEESLSIGGIRLGMTVDQVQALLGAEHGSAKESRVSVDDVMHKTRRTRYQVTAWSYPERGMTVSFAQGKVVEITGATIESDGLVIAQQSEPREIVSARLGNVMGRGMWDNPVNRNLRGNWVWDSFETNLVRVRLPGGPVPGFALRGLPWGACGSAWDDLTRTTHPVNYATLMKLHGHPITF